jgi:hypothetical protein
MILENGYSLEFEPYYFHYLTLFFLHVMGKEIQTSNLYFIRHGPQLIELFLRNHSTLISRKIELTREKKC